MNRYLYLDLETIPAQRPDVLEEITENTFRAMSADIAAIRPPDNIKKQESIDAWMKDEAPAKAQALRDAADADIDAAYRKTGLDGAFGQICVIGFALDNAKPDMVWFDDYADCERCLLDEFQSRLSHHIPRSSERGITVVGHNVANFDLRFMVQRSIVNGIRPHPVIASAAQAKPWEADKVYDTMIQWAGVGGRASLDKLCKALSIQTPKTGITGAQVWDEVKAGRIADVAAYCARDVEATRAAHLRMTFQAAPQPQQELADLDF